MAGFLPHSLQWIHLPAFILSQAEAPPLPPGTQPTGGQSG